MATPSTLEVEDDSILGDFMDSSKEDVSILGDFKDSSKEDSDSNHEDSDSNHADSDIKHENSNSGAAADSDLDSEADGDARLRALPAAFLTHVLTHVLPDPLQSPGEALPVIEVNYVLSVPWGVQIEEGTSYVFPKPLDSSKEMLKVLRDSFPEYGHLDMMGICKQVVATARMHCSRVPLEDPRCLSSVEFCSGRAAISRSILAAGLKAAAFDLLYSASHDLRSAGGFRKFVLALCCVHEGGLAWGAPM